MPRLAAEAKATLHIVYVHDVRKLNAAAGEASYLFAATWEKEKRAAEKRLKKVKPTVTGVAYKHAFASLVIQLPISWLWLMKNNRT